MIDKSHYIEVIKVPPPPFKKGTYLNRDWQVGDKLFKIGTAYGLGFWTNEEDPNDDIYQNQRTKETINLCLMCHPGDKEYFKWVKIMKKAKKVYKIEFFKQDGLGLKEGESYMVNKNLPACPLIKVLDTQIKGKWDTLTPEQFNKRFVQKDEQLAEINNLPYLGK